MVTSYCDNCGNTYHWNWEDAFNKFGFGDGDGKVETWQIDPGGQYRTADDLVDYRELLPLSQLEAF